MSNFASIHSAAHAAGMQALEANNPTPMVVSETCGERRQWYVSEGACGFAWVEFAGNTAWGRWAKKSGIASSHYPSGLCLWVSEGGQSVERKEAYARAYAQALRDSGIKARANSRLD